MREAAVIGLGVVGRTMVALGGERAIGIDIDPGRIDLCKNSGGRATDDISAARGCKLVFVCVGTPSLDDGQQDSSSLRRALEQLKPVLEREAIVVIRSTITPDAYPRDYPNPVAVNPEFLRDASAMEDALAPPFVVVGADSAQTAQPIFEWYESCGVRAEAPQLLCSPMEAILLKYACNWFHAAKVEFANMIGEMASNLDADGSKVMEMFGRDTILNISDRYLEPGGPFGGACLPKDLRAGVTEFRRFADVRLLEAVYEANRGRATKPS